MRREVEGGRVALERSQHVGVRGYAAPTVKAATDYDAQVEKARTVAGSLQ